MFNIQGLRAISLLRVSTNKQTTKDERDIPAQRDLVRKFIENEELILVREFIEGGISGYKTKVADRDALISIKEMAERNEFDVLVVYYSDRIGRSSEESPLVISYLNNHDVRVFSTREGEIKSKSPMDKLMTYLTYWQNESESVKISNRSSDYRVIQVQNGKFQGGGGKSLPYGYKLVMRGNKNANGKVIYDFEINQEEAEIIRLIYNLSIEDNKGARAIANFLNEHEEYKTKSKSGEGWSFRTVQNICNGIIYKGYYHMNSKLRNEHYISPQQEDLIIIPEEIWEKNQQAIQSRKNKGNKPIKGTSSGKSLLAGLVYCGHCGSKMHLWDNHKRKRKDGTSYITNSYRCYNKMTRIGKVDCDGQSTYSCNKIDTNVEEEIKIFIQELSNKKLNGDFYEELKSSVELSEKTKKDKTKELEDKQKQIITLKKEIPNAMTGNGVFTVQELKESMEFIQADVEELLKEIILIDDNVNKSKLALLDYTNLEYSLDDWETRYFNTDIFGKKSMLNQIIEKVTIRKEGIEISYKIHVKLFDENSKVIDNLCKNIIDERLGESNLNMGCGTELKRD